MLVSAPYPSTSHSHSSTPLSHDPSDIAAPSPVRVSSCPQQPLLSNFIRSVANYYWVSPVNYQSHPSNLRKCVYEVALSYHFRSIYRGISCLEGLKSLSNRPLITGLAYRNENKRGLFKFYVSGLSKVFAICSISSSIYNYENLV